MINKINARNNRVKKRTMAIDDWDTCVKKAKQGNGASWGFVTGKVLANAQERYCAMGYGNKNWVV